MTEIIRCGDCHAHYPNGSLHICDPLMKALVSKKRMTNKIKPKTKIFRYYTIKIDLKREKKKIDDGGVAYKDICWYAEIIAGHSKTMFCETTLRKLFKHIKEELYL